MSERDLLQQRNSWLIAKQQRIKVAHEAATSYMKSSQAQYRTIADVIIMALSKSKAITAAPGGYDYGIRRFMNGNNNGSMRETLCDCHQEVESAL